MAAPIPNRSGSQSRPPGKPSTQARGVDGQARSLEPEEIGEPPGGDAKGVDQSPLREVLKGRVRAMLTLGVDGPQLMCIARSMGIDAYVCDSIENAVNRAADLAATGETVLLSPACSSLDMFASYAERGERFAAAVGRLDGSAT